MKLKLLIPATNIPDGLFAEIEDFLRIYLPEDCQVAFDSLQYGFPSVENELSGMVNGAQAAVQLYKEKEELQGVFIDCFDDPGVYQCREMLEVPVVGAYSAAISTALQCAERIGIITTDEAGILNEEDLRAVKAEKKKPGVFARIGKWFKDMKSELKKVQWPTRKQTINNTLIVIACVVIVGIFIWIFDFLAGTAIDLIITTLS